MSQLQFVTHGDRGFWAYDVALAILLKYAIDAAASRESNPEWLETTINDWRIVASISDYGLGLSTDWSSEQAAAVVELFDRACDELGRREEIASDEVESWTLLDGRRFHTRGATSIRTDSVIGLGHAIRDLILGRLVAAPIGTAWCYGHQPVPETIPMRDWDAAER